MSFSTSCLRSLWLIRSSGLCSSSASLSFAASSIPCTSCSYSTEISKPRSIKYFSAPLPVPTLPYGPLTVRYPFPIDYLKDREMVVHDLARRPLGVASLKGPLFNVPVRIDILHRVVRYLRAKWQQGTHKAKTRGEVSGGRRKPRPQKKTGRSRQGSIRSPLWRGGGANFGPRPRSHAHKLPKNVQVLGMKCALSAKCNEGRMVVVESLASAHGSPVRPQAMVPMITALMRGAGGNGPAACSSALLVDCGDMSKDGGQSLRSAASLMEGVEVMSFEDLTVYHILKYKALVISKPALHQLSQRLASPQHRLRLPIKRAWFSNELKEFEKAAAELGSSGPAKISI